MRFSRNRDFGQSEFLKFQSLTVMWCVLPIGNTRNMVEDNQWAADTNVRDSNNDTARHSHLECAVRRMADLFLVIFDWIWLAPIFVTIVGGVFALRVQSRRWIVHLCVFGCLLAALPAFLELWSTIDPDAAGEPTNAFTALHYLIVMVGFGLAYAVFALVLFYNRRRIA